MSKFIQNTAIFGAIFTFGTAFSACSASDSLDSVGEPGVSLGSVDEPLVVQRASACNNYEAENIGRTGGSSTSGGWKLTAAGDNINVNRQFTTGEHQFAIIARGTAGGGQKPQLKLTLNGTQIGGNIVVTNTGITDGWKEYVITYNVGTGNNKLIKVELANPGSGRALLLDGVSVYCPKAGVFCNGAPGCASCCAQTDTCGACNIGGGSGAIGCDQNSDCSNQEICVLRGTAFNGYAVGCFPKPDCDEQALIGGAACGEICKTPYGPEKACSNGKVCVDTGSNTFFTHPGWKYCVAQ
jgi:hypothetical protein